MAYQSNNINTSKQLQQWHKKSTQQQQQSHNYEQPYNSQISYILCEQLSNSAQNSINYIRKSKHDLKISKILKSKDIKISSHKLPINANINNSNNSILPMSILNKSITSKTNGNRQNQYNQEDNQQYEQIYNNDNMNLNINMNNSRLSKQQKQQESNIKKSISISNNHRNYHYQNIDKQIQKLTQKQPSIFSTAASNPFIKKIQKKQSGKSIYRNIKQTHSEQKPYRNQQHLQLQKQNSHNFLDKNHYVLMDRNVITYMPIEQISKLEERICLPVLVNGNGNNMMKNNNSNNNNNKAINRLQQNSTSINTNNTTNPELFPNCNSFSPQPPYLSNESCTPLPTPYTQKIVKIPIQRLKPLKPQQIKLKYQKKIKQEQRNRAKDIAIQIFNKQEENNQINQIDDLLKEEQSDRENLIEKDGMYSVDSRIKKNTNHINGINPNLKGNPSRNSHNIFGKGNSNPEKNDHQYIDLQREYIHKKTNYNSNKNPKTNNSKDVAYNFTNGKSQNIFKKQLLVYNS